MILKNLPHPGFSAVFHREGKIFKAKIANSLVSIKKVQKPLEPNPSIDCP
jgi:hypothetical protein